MIDKESFYYKLSIELIDIGIDPIELKIDVTTVDDTEVLTITNKDRQYSFRVKTEETLHKDWEKLAVNRVLYQMRQHNYPNHIDQVIALEERMNDFSV